MSCSTSRRNSVPTASTTSTNIRPKRGSLDLLLSLALDIICEIFCFLHPADLFVLARTSKALRRFLLKRSAAFIWRSALQSVSGLPDKPSDMSEIQYASLVFGSVCHYEGCDGKARDTVWHLRIRSCASCRPKHRPIKADECDDYLALCTMLACFPDTLEQYIPCGPFLNSKGKCKKGFQGHHIKEFADQLRSLPSSQRQTCLDHRKQVTEAIHHFASAGVAWQLEAKDARITELRNKRAARAENIRERLIAIGFREEIDYFGWDRIRKHTLINSTRAITDEAYSSILDQLTKYMLGWRELRMEEQVYTFRRRIFVTAWSKFTETGFHNAPRGSPYLPLPPNATIGFSENVDAIIRQCDTMSDESLLTAFSLAREYILEWHRKTRRELASLLPSYKVEDDDETVLTRLKLAASVFQCTSGRCRSEGRPLAYPEILFHPCFTLVTRGNPPPKDPRSIAYQQACLVMGRPWNCIGRVQVHPKQDLVNRVVLCYGRDPGSTTAAEMDEQNCRLVCLECATRHKVIAFMSWRSAIQHNITSHPNLSLTDPWFTVTHPPRVPIGMSISKSLRSFPSAPGCRLNDYSICLLCPPRIPSWNTRFGFGDLLHHIKTKHGILSPALGKHYTFDTNITPVYLDLVINQKCSISS